MNNDLEQFTDLELEGMAHGNNPVANAYRELLAFRIAAKQAKPIGYISERHLNALGKQFSVCVKHEPVMARPIPLYTTPLSAHTEQRPYIYGFDPALAGSEATVITNYFTPDGWKLVPIEPTEDMVINGFESEPDETFSPDEEWEAYKAMSGCEQAAHRAKLCWQAMLRAAPKPEIK